jgi:hypothetical protein
MEKNSKQKSQKELRAEDELLDSDLKKAEIFIDLGLKMGLNPEEIAQMAKDAVKNVVQEVLDEDKENKDPKDNDENSELDQAMAAWEITSELAEEFLSFIIGESADNPE